MPQSLPQEMMTRIRGEMGLVALADATAHEIAENQKIVDSQNNLDRPPEAATWFIPYSESVLKGGIRTIYALAEQMSIRWGAHNYLVCYSFSGADFDEKKLETQLAEYFPNLMFDVIKFRRGVHDIQSIPDSDIAFCTLWTTAYLLLKYNRTKKKFYFMQDFEPSFYPAGSVFGVIEATYRFGFTCIANTPGVAACYRRYNADVLSFTPGIDSNVFFPATNVWREGEDINIVYYGRPANDRNGFALGLAALRKIKDKLGRRVNIVSAGAEWDPADFGVSDVVSNVGFLSSLEDVAGLYRDSHAGMVFMFSAHPSYQPFEYMACGCVTVTNRNEYNSWLLEDNRNCLAVNPVPEVIAESVFNLFNSPDQYHRLRANGLKTAAKYSWSNTFNALFRDMMDWPK